MDITSILDDVVRQFADPLAFYRELVQNAIDAGTGEVDISLRYDDTTGQAEIEVCDAGEGMNREIIEGRLLRLFSSSKDDDLTKIGRFGIGFVSVFAIEPDLVVVETGRGGEYWRILFDADRSYELYALDMPREGTTITILKSMPADRFPDFAERSRAVAQSWCHHASVPIYWMGEDLREPFDVDSPVTVSRAEQGTQIIMGLAETARGAASYYNRGLTLKANAESPWPYVTFKIDSRYLEHTLTRDQLIEDEHFQRAMVLLEELATEELPRELLRELEASAKRGTSGLLEHLLHLRRAGHSLPSDWQSRPILPTLSGPVSIDDLRDTEEEVYFLQSPGPLEALRPDALFLVGHRQEPLGSLVGEFLDPLPDQLDDRWLLPGTLTDRAPGLSQRAQTLLATTRPGTRVLIDDLSLISEVTTRTLGMVIPDGDEPVDLYQSATAPSLDALGDGTLLVVDSTRDEIARVTALSEEEPHLAAVAFLRLLFPPHTPAIADELDHITLAALEEMKGLSA